jgi:hypothetical protein
LPLYRPKIYLGAALTRMSPLWLGGTDRNWNLNSSRAFSGCDEAGVPLKAIQDLAGHKTIQVTARFPISTLTICTALWNS